MNDCKFSGRLTRDPEIRYTGEGKAVANYTLAVDRWAKEGGQQADFLSFTAFGKMAEFTEKYMKKGMKMIVECHAQSGSYKKDGKKVYYTRFIVDRQEFCESKGRVEEKQESMQQDDGFMHIPEGTEELPFE